MTISNSNSSSFTTIDLIASSKQHIIFLQELHRFGITIEDLSQAVGVGGDWYCFSARRYSQLWLPFVLKYGKTKKLVPPADIAWLWHCHRLAPYRYARYIKDRFYSSPKDDGDEEEKYFLDQNPPFVFATSLINKTISTKELEVAVKDTKDIFEKEYPGESFFLSRISHTSMKLANLRAERNAKICLGSPLGGFDVIESCTRQSTFLWQVSQPNFSQDEFLQQGVSNYEKFAKLMGSPEKPTFLIPTYQIDLMWHTHILASIQKYHNDNIRMNSKILEHDDSLNDRSEGSTLNTNFEATEKLWKMVYGEEYSVQGGMYRGEPPHDWFPKRWMSIDHPSAFEPARPKSTGTGNLPNNNPKKIGYVFGKGGELTVIVIVLKSDEEYLKHKSYTYMCSSAHKSQGMGILQSQNS